MLVILLDSTRNVFDNTVNKPVDKSALARGEMKMEQLAITVRVRNVYGNRVVYPVCDKAKIFAQMAGHSTLTPATLDCIRRLGYLIEVQQETIEV